MNNLMQGHREYEALMGTSPEVALAAVRTSSPHMYRAIIEDAFGRSLSDADLARKTREIATVAILAAAGGAERQLAVHARAALRSGVTASELRALCEHVALYAGFPRALNALSVVDAVLADAASAQPPQFDTVSIADHETVVAHSGDSGPPVVLIHALGLDWRMWRPIMPTLSVGRRVFAYDIRSHGAAAGSPTPFTMSDTAEDLLRVLDALNLDRAHIVGLSFGGGIAQTAAVARPDRVASLALLATTDFPFDTFEARARSGETDGIEAQVVPTLTRWFTPDALAADGWGVRYARERIRRNDASDWAASWRAFKGLDVRGRLERFESPTLVLAGELDASTTPRIMAGIADRIPGATFRQLDGTPHMQTLEQPTLVARALDEFLPAETGSEGRASVAS
jgi:3-oxoadipate enol-lactonase